MTNDIIIKKAVAKAVKNGWRPEGVDYNSICVNERIILKTLYNFPFNHDFAKAFWGEMCTGENGVSHKPYDFMCTPEWQFQLQQLVLMKEPIKYLEQFL